MTDQQFDALTEEIRGLAREIAKLQGEKDNLEGIRSLSDEVLYLKESIEDLKIKELRLREEQEKEKRETRHMVGLERKRQEFEAEQHIQEIDLAKQEAVLVVREENLDSEREAFEKQMEFITDRLTSETGYLREIMESILGRLPDVSVTLEREFVGAAVNGDD
jgi:DNA repair exonuclease SbcCD ATPase subunit